MAITGLIGIGYVIVHMIGNLKMYFGPPEADRPLRRVAARAARPAAPRTVFLWLLRIVLIGALVLHLHAAYSLTVINRRARPVRYQSPRDYIAANFASRTMRWTGIIVLLFLFFHLADLTWGWFNPDFVRGAVYHNVDASLSRCRWRSCTSSPTSPSASTCSTGCGACSSRWGGTRPGSTSGGDRAAAASPRLIVVGNVSFPVAVLAGIVDRSDRSPPGSSVNLDDKVPAGPLADKWDSYISDSKLVNPNNKRKFKILVVGTGLAGGSAAATLAELGYQVEAFTFHDSPRRAHSIAAQGGINAAKNYRGDGDSIHRLFYDTIKGGDFRAREGNVYRLAQMSVNIIDQCVAQGVPFAREYGGLLDNRSFGGAQVSRTFYVGGQTGQQLLLGAYQQMARQVGLGNVELWNRVRARRHRRRRRALRRDRRPRPAHRRDRARTPATPWCCAPAATATCSSSPRTRWRATSPRSGGPTAGRLVRQPVLHADPPDVHPAVRRVPVEAHADVRVVAQRRPGVGAQEGRRQSPARRRSPRRTATTTWSGSTRASATSRRATSRRGPPSAGGRLRAAASGR